MREGSKESWHKRYNAEINHSTFADRLAICLNASM